MLLLLLLALSYVYQFSLTEAYAPSFLQYSAEAVGTAPFGFTPGGRVRLDWTPFTPAQWNVTKPSSASNEDGQGFFVDYQGHWRPPVVWTPAMAPTAWALGMCQAEVCVHNGKFNFSQSLSELLARGHLEVLRRWNVTEEVHELFSLGKNETSGHAVLLVWSLDRPLTPYLFELQHLRLALTNHDLESFLWTHLASGQRGIPELYLTFLVLWSVALLLLLANQWLRRKVATSVHVWYMVVLFALRVVQLVWACTLWWVLRFEGYLQGSMVLWLSAGQVGDFWLRLVWTVGSCIVALDAPILTTSKPARTALTWMLLVALVAMFFSITFADLTWWLWGAMLMWTDWALQFAFTFSLLWIFRLDALREKHGKKKSKFADARKCAYGIFNVTMAMPMTYEKLLFVADAIRSSPVWFRGDMLVHFALLEVFHALFAVWVVLVVTARVARDDVRARAFRPLSESDIGRLVDEALAGQAAPADVGAIQMEVFRPDAAPAPAPAPEAAAQPRDDDELSKLKQQQEQVWSNTPL